MAGLLSALQRTSQALNAQSQGIYTAGRNMANVNNPAYARQRVQLGDSGTYQTPLGPQSYGVEVQAVQNVRDALLDRQVVRETSYTASLEAESEAYRKAELALGQRIDRQSDAQFVGDSTATGASQGVGEAFDDLLNAFSSLAANPRSDAERQILFQKAQTLVTRMRTTDARLEDVQQELSDAVSSDVKSVNDLLESISNLNKQIARFEVGNQGAALDLRDQRQAKLEALAQYVDFEVEDVGGSAGQIRILSRDATDAPVVLLDKGNDPAAMTFDGTNILAGNPAAALNLRGGSMQGRLTARDGAVADLRDGLDVLAAQLVTTLNSIYNPGAAGSDFFAAGGTTAATIALDPALAASNIRSTNTAEPGANDVALAISDVMSRTFSQGGGDIIDGTLGSHYRGLVSSIANATAATSGHYDDQNALKRLVLERRDSVSGVSLDEEMTDLIKYQRAFDASAKVMQIMDQMLEVVVNGLVR